MANPPLYFVGMVANSTVPSIPRDSPQLGLLQENGYELRPHRSLCRFSIFDN